MPLMLYDTLTRTLREFKPLKDNRVNMFVCGPTVYDLSHLGHARTYVAYDVMARYLKQRGYSVFYLMNITDIDDKIIKRAHELKTTPSQLAEDMTKEFYRDLKALKIETVNLFARASEHIQEIVEQIKALIEKGYAYVVDGDVYYDISRFSDYGRLSHQKPEELVKHRIDPNPKKRNPGDFALWKSAKPGEPSWNSPWGEGRPGWHIEDTAITITYFGPQYDIHGGAVELVFPHHEAEIAQAEAYTGAKPLVNFWVHTGVLTINGKKMSKSLKNFITIREALRESSPEALRMFFLSSHYRSPIDFTYSSLKQSEENVKTINAVYRELKALANIGLTPSTPKDGKLLEELKSMEEELYKAMDDDFNTPKALAVILQAVKKINEYISSHPSSKGVEASLRLLEKIDEIFGFLRGEKAEDEKAEKLMDVVLKIREELRSRKEYELSDALRKHLHEAGFIVEDTPNGPKWSYR
jgi:cysteinyl-tRNA synthetase